MKKPNVKYYQIPTPKGVISKFQYIPNPKNGSIGNYLSLGFTQGLVVLGFRIYLVVLVILEFGIFGEREVKKQK